MKLKKYQIIDFYFYSFRLNDIVTSHVTYVHVLLVLLVHLPSLHVP